MKLTLRINLLKAALEVASKKDAHFYLCSVRVVAKDGKVTLYATDGQVLGIFNGPDQSASGDVDVILKRDGIESLLRRASKKAETELLTIEPGADHAMAQFPDGTLRVDIIDATYPDLDYVIRECCAQSRFDHAVIAAGVMQRVVKSACALGEKACVQWQSIRDQESCRAVAWYADCYATYVVMPMRAHVPDGLAVAPRQGGSP